MSIMKLNVNVCNSFNKSAAEYHQAAVVQREIGERLFERLIYLKIKPQFVLDLGCGPGYFSKQLKKYYKNATIVSFDCAHGMLKETKKLQGFLQKWPLVCGDMAALPFATGVFDLVFSNQVIHWAEALPPVARELNRVMKPDGCLMFSTLGPDTFVELRQAWSGIDTYGHANEFSDLHNIGDTLLAESFMGPVLDMEYLTAHFSSVEQLLSALKTQGVKNINASRNKGLTGKGSWRRFEDTMSSFKTDTGKFPLTYEVVYGHAWKGMQQRMERGIETRVSIAQLKTMKR